MKTEGGSDRAVRQSEPIIRPGYETIYPGSHELRPLALIRLESPLVPEGMLVIASLQKSLAHPDLLAGRTPAQILDLLSEAASAFADQTRQSKEVLAMLGPDTRSTQSHEKQTPQAGE